MKTDNKPITIKASESIGIGTIDPKFKFCFTGEVIIEITKGKFYWRGKEVKDKYKVYERFNEWLKLYEFKENILLENIL